MALVIAAIVVVAGGAVAAGLLLGGGDEDGTGSATDDASGSAQATAAALADVWKDKDCAAFDALLTERFRAAEEPCSADRFDGWPTDSATNPEIVEQTDDSATAELDVSQTDFAATYEVVLVNEDGVWLIDAIETKVAFSGPTA